MIAYEVQQGQTAQPLLFLMIRGADHLTGMTGLAPTVTISRAGEAFRPPEGAVTEVGKGWYAVAPTAADTGVLGPLVLHAEAVGADPTDTIFPVVSYDPLALTVPATLTPAGLDAVLIASGITSGRVVDPVGVPLTQINARQALAAVLAVLVGDRAGVATPTIAASIPGDQTVVRATRTTKTTIQTTATVP